MVKLRSQLLAGLKKATIEMLLLKLLAEQDMYGYQMTQQLKKRSNGLYTVLEGSMYPILYRLEEQEYICHYEEKVGKRQTRVYYHLEENGEKYLAELYDAYKQALAVVNFLYDSGEGDVFENEEAGDEELL
ncbi:MAG: helix-turn-helix transcriptional regulator [Lachnospiraceae bacterium]|nr:helix-turn-helix transcriptional regulator [Lachnospiraceae bacterium]